MKRAHPLTSPSNRVSERYAERLYRQQARPDPTNEFDVACGRAPTAKDAAVAALCALLADYTDQTVQVHPESALGGAMWIILDAAFGDVGRELYRRDPARPSWDWCDDVVSYAPAQQRARPSA